MLGVSLRPWPGRSPLGLIIRGALHAGVCPFLLYVLVRESGRADTSAMGAEAAQLGSLLVLIGISQSGHPEGRQAGIPRHDDGFALNRLCGSPRKD